MCVCVCFDYAESVFTQRSSSVFHFPLTTPPYPLVLDVLFGYMKAQRVILYEIVCVS